MWPAYVINLADNAQRMKNVSSQLDAQGISHQRIEGVNGWNLPESEISQVYDKAANRRHAKHPLVKPEIGCYLSHIEAWKRIAEADAPGGFIFEDDFAADPSLAEKLTLLSATQDKWDMVKLFSFDPDPPMTNTEPLGPYQIGIPYRVPTCLIGYGLTTSGAKKLSERAIPFFRPVDEDQKFVWEAGLRVALITPPPLIVGDQEAETGTIGSVRRASRSDRSALSQALHGLRYQLNYAINLRRHRRKNGIARSLNFFAPDVVNP